MSILGGPRYLDEQLESFVHGQPIVVAVFRNGHAPYKFHDRIGPARFGRSCVKNLDNIRVIHYW